MPLDPSLNQGTVVGLGDTGQTTPAPSSRSFLGPTTGGERFVTTSTGALVTTAAGVPVTTDYGGPYDPTAYYTDTGTIEPVVSYTAGMWWTASGSGFLPVDSVTFVDGDRILAASDSSNQYWTVDEVTFVVLPTNVTDLLQAPPHPGRGHPIGVTDWRYCVEIALPDDPTGSWGEGEWGTAVWNSLQWTDLTPFSRGESWTRGSDDPYGRPRVGELNIEISNPDDQWSPFNATSPHGSPAYFGPGTLVRVSVHSPTHDLIRWIPQITCIIDSWTFATRGSGADRPIIIHGWETLRDLAGIDDLALTGVVGLGEDGAERIDRLLTAAEWQYGLKVDAENLSYETGVGGDFFDLQSTDMATNRLGECYVAADSSDCEFRTDRSGAALVSAVNWTGYDGGATVSIWPLLALSNSLGTRPGIGFDHYEHRETNEFADFLYVPYDADTFDLVNEDAYLVNDARFARAGSTQKTYVQPASIARFGRRQLVRSDFVCRFDLTVSTIARLTTARRGLNTLRLDNVDVSTSDRGDDVYLTVLATDIGCEAYAYPPDGATGLARDGRVFGHIRSMTHRVTPRNSGRVTWSTSFAIDTRAIEGLPAGQVPENTDAPET